MKSGLLVAAPEPSQLSHIITFYNGHQSQYAHLHSSMLSYAHVNFVTIERLSTTYFFPANGREGHVTSHLPRLSFAGRRFYARGTFFPFGGNAKTWVFAAHFYRLFVHFDRLLLWLCFGYHPTSTKTAYKAKRVSNSSGKYITSPYPFCLVAVNGDREHLPYHVYFAYFKRKLKKYGPGLYWTGTMLQLIFWAKSWKSLFLNLHLVNT